MLFVHKKEVLKIHARLLRESGGMPGLRDEGALESALVAAETRNYYAGAGLVVCGATYAYHLSQAHAFIDGNKRVAAAAAEFFVNLNDAAFTATNDEIVEFFLALAAGTVTRDEVERCFAQWVSVGD
jgi:death on curing protein